MTPILAREFFDALFRLRLPIQSERPMIGGWPATPAPVPPRPKPKPHTPLVVYRGGTDERGRRRHVDPVKLRRQFEVMAKLERLS